MYSSSPAIAAPDDHGLCLQMSFSEGSLSNSTPAARQTHSAMHEEADGLAQRGTASSLSCASVSPDDSLHECNSHSMQDAPDAVDRMSGSSSPSSVTANLICSDNYASEPAILAVFSPNHIQEEGQGESAYDERHTPTGRSRKRSNDLVVGEKLKSVPLRRPNSHSTARHGLRPLNKFFCEDIKQDQEYFQQILGSSSYGWTDEKHSSYLDSMEADFMRNIMFREHAGEPANAYSSDLTDSASSQQAACKQFKICQNGRWRPMSVPTASYVGPLTHIAVVVKNPWIRRFRTHSKPRVAPLGSMETTAAPNSVARTEAHA